MRIPLNQFEQIIEPIILKRGYDYFNHGEVHVFEENQHGITFTVLGTREYAVALNIEGDVIADFMCDCPYDEGPVCKHVVACIFYLMQEKLDLDIKKPKVNSQTKRGRPINRPGRPLPIQEESPVKKKSATKSTPKQKKSSSAKAIASKLLTSLSADELRGYLEQHIFTDKEQLNAFITTFSSGTEAESKEMYARQIKTILRSARSDHGFIPYHEARKVGGAVYSLLQRASDHFASGRYRSVFLMCCAILEEMVAALGYGDDSNGDFGGNADAAYELMASLGNAVIPEDLRNELFAYALTQYSKRTFYGWDWHLGMAELATSLHRTAEEARRVRIIFEQTPGSEYEQEKQQELIFNLILTVDGPEVARSYAESHMQNRQFREMMIRDAMDKADYAQVKKLAEEGIKQDLKPRPGLVSKWYDCLIAMARAQDDIDTMIAYARTTMLQHAMDPETYYNQLKELVPAASWMSFVDDLIADIKRSRDYRLHEFVPVMLASEEQWEKLMDYITDKIDRQRDNGTLETYSHPLAEMYPERYFALCKKELLRDAKHMNQRSDYKRFCQELRRLKKLGFREQVMAIVNDMRKEYQRRPAMMEELDGV